MASKVVVRPLPSWAPTPDARSSDWLCGSQLSWLTNLTTLLYMVQYMVHGQDDGLFTGAVETRTGTHGGRGESL